MVCTVVQTNFEYLDGFDVRKTRTDSSNSSNTLRKKKSTKSSWDIMDNYVVTLSTASKVNCDTKRAPEVSCFNLLIWIDLIGLVSNCRSVFRWDCFTVENHYVSL